MLSRVIRRNARAVSFQTRAFSRYAILRQQQQPPVTPSAENPEAKAEGKGEEAKEVKESIETEATSASASVGSTATPETQESSNILNELLKQKAENEEAEARIPELNTPEVFQIIESLLPDPTSVKSTLSFNDRYPASHPTRDSLPSLPTILNDTTTNQYIAELTQSSFTKLADIAQAKKLLLAITNAAIVENKETADGVDLGIHVSKTSALYLIDYLCLIKYYDLAQKLRNKCLDESDKDSTTAVLESLFYRFDSIYHRQVFINHLNDLKENEIKLSGLLIYRIYQSFENDKVLQDKFYDLLKEKGLVDKIFGNETALNKLETLEEFDEFANEKNLDMETDYELREFKFRIFLKLGLIDDFLKLTEQYPDHRLSRDSLEYVTSAFLKQDRLNEYWHFMKSNYKINKRKCKLIMNHLGETNQHVFLLPFAQIVKRHPGYSLFPVAWHMLLAQRKATFTEDKSQPWWLLSTGIVQNAAQARDPRIKPIASKLIDFVNEEKGIEWDPLADGQSPELKHASANMRKSLSWKMRNPNFNLETNTDQFKEFAKLFNPEVGSSHVTKVKEYLENDELANALTYIKELGDKANKYQVFPVVTYFTSKNNLLGLIEFINEIESTTSLKIKFDALSQYAYKIVNVKTVQEVIENNPENKEKLNLIYNYLYTETKLNTSAWGSAIARDELLDLGIEFKEIEDNGLEQLSEALDIFKREEKSILKE